MFNSLVKRDKNVGVGFPTDKLDGWFGDLFDSFWNSPGFQLDRNWRPTDFKETDKEYITEIELPRFTKDQVKVEALNGTISVEAKVDEDNYKSYYKRTFSYPNADAGAAKTKLENGVLTVTVPKRPKPEGKVIQID